MKKYFILVFKVLSSNVKCIFVSGEICRKTLKPNQKYVCTATRHCNAFKESIRTRNYLDICKFIGLKPIVCCPITANEILKTKNAERSISADESMNTFYQIYIFYNILKTVDERPQFSFLK